MSIQSTDAQNGGETATETENISEVLVGGADSSQTDGQNSPVDGDSANETAAGVPNSSGDGEQGSDSAADSAENACSEAGEASNPAAAQDGIADENSRDSPVGDTARLDQKIAELEAQLADSRDQLLRKAADAENFRKRMNQEKQNAIEFANKSLILDIIPIIDDFDRAIQSAGTSAELAELPAGKAMMDGLTMIQKRLTSQLEGKWGLKRFNSVGEPFDPNRHEAMMMEKSPDIEEPVVQEEFLKGYMLKDRVIRAAQVKVLMPGGE
jgi:molecular chaperone GrpE